MRAADVGSSDLERPDGARSRRGRSLPRPELAVVDGRQLGREPGYSVVTAPPVIVKAGKLGQASVSCLPELMPVGGGIGRVIRSDCPETWGGRTRRVAARYER
jgi:hypothetical protein